MGLTSIAACFESAIFRLCTFALGYRTAKNEQISASQQWISWSSDTFGPCSSSAGWNVLKLSSDHIPLVLRNSKPNLDKSLKMMNWQSSSPNKLYRYISYPALTKLEFKSPKRTDHVVQVRGRVTDYPLVNETLIGRTAPQWFPIDLPNSAQPGCWSSGPAGSFHNLARFGYGPESMEDPGKQWET